MSETVFDDHHEAIARLATPVIVFGMMRNEILRLESWLAHYRAIGCGHFVVVDNGSTDGTFELLQAQPDVLAIRTLDSFGKAGCGIAWLNEFRALLAPDRWVLFADADELLVYAGWPTRGVASLVEEIERAGANALWAFLMDMYPDGPIAPVDPPRGADPFGLAPCFDRDYHFHFPPAKPWQKDMPALEIIGGPRLRNMSTVRRELRVSWVDRFIRGQLDRVLPRTPDRLLPLLFRYFPQSMPALFKSPLARAGGGIRYINNHDLRGASYFKKNAVVCHFKFLGDFAKKVQNEVGRKEHYRKGAEYFRYHDILTRRKQLDFRYTGSLRFESVEALEALGLLTESPVYQASR